MDSDSWYTPAPIVEAARDAMGGIELDPASHEEANLIVKAERYFTEQDNGLIQSWACRSLFLNPPGGLVAEFWLKLMTEWAANRIGCATWIGYSLEQLQTLQIACAQSKAPTPLDYAICYPRKRIAFVENDAKKSLRMQNLIAQGKKPNEKSSPSHANYVAFLGNCQDVIRFERVFSPFGRVVL
jgi:hypothetical protein